MHLLFLVDCLDCDVSRQRWKLKPKVNICVVKKHPPLHLKPAPSKKKEFFI